MSRYLWKLVGPTEDERLLWRDLRAFISEARFVASVALRVARVVVGR